MPKLPLPDESLSRDFASADNKPVSITGWGRCVALVALVVVANLAPRPAVATDIEALRSEAQSLGAHVSELETDLAAANSRAERLRGKMEQTSRQLGLLELQKHELDEAHAEALDRFVSRAVTSYKEGPGSRLELLLGARTMSELLTMAETQMRAADRDSAAVAELIETKDALDGRQTMIDRRQIDMASQAVAVETVSTELAAIVAQRQATLTEVVGKIRAIERQARLAAAASARPDQAFLELLAPAGPAPEIPDGFAPTGVSFEGVASWYGPGFEGNHTASGDVFDPNLYTAASRDLPLGTWLFVRHGTSGVVVLVNDRGPFIEGRILDLSQAAAESLGIGGLGWIEAELLIKT